ncbi:MAG: diguanylate cyclase, partial [Pseudomonadota bacterium]
QQAQLIAHHLGRFGYSVQIFGDTPSFLQAVAREAPSAAVLDIVLPEGKLAGTQAAAALKATVAEHIPVVFVSVRSDYEARVHAVRAGGAAYLTKPLDMIELINTLDKLIGSQHSDPHRVLLVDDSAPEAEFFSQALRLAGMDARVATGPESMLQLLAEFDPDLVLMDMYLSDCRGDELALVTRQMTRYAGLPIVFLSTESNFDRQLDAMQRAGDEFLTKPIRPAQLVKAVSTRIARHRELRALMTRDSLTGLSNHNQLHRQLEAEVARAQRAKLALSFVMIDVDHFKIVNDSYGHPVGDSVLRTLSRFLRQRLRQADAVGRYGGEEFAVVLTDTDAPAAARVIDQLREDFSATKHTAPNGEFCVTFSAGIAAVSPSAKPADLVIAADKALYQAKRDGRNRVVVVGQ